mgnify:FL=1
MAAGLPPGSLVRLREHRGPGAGNSGCYDDAVTDGAGATPLTVALRPVSAADHPRLLELNNQAVPAVPTETLESMAELLEVSQWSVVAEDGNGVVQGAVITVSPGAEYHSENYRYFEETFDQHFYIDRVFVDQAARSGGIGRVLYRAVEDESRRLGIPAVTCEVNLEPPNPQSLAFHHREGFRDLDTQSTKGGSVVVQLMVKDVVVE